MDPNNYLKIINKTFTVVLNAIFLFFAGIYYWVLWRRGLQTDFCGMYIATKLMTVRDKNNS